MLPGILLITIASGIAYTAYRLFLDLQGGIFERFQSMPIARSSVLWAHVLTSLAANLVSVVIVVGVALLMGFRTGAGVLALARGRRHPGPVHPRADLARRDRRACRRRPSTARARSRYPLIFLPFISSAFVPTDTMPGPVHGSPRTSR